jgi:hypothetical protein
MVIKMLEQHSKMMVRIRQSLHDNRPGSKYLIYFPNPAAPGPGPFTPDFRHQKQAPAVTGGLLFKPLFYDFQRRGNFYVIFA